MKRNKVWAKYKRDKMNKKNNKKKKNHFLQVCDI